MNPIPPGLRWMKNEQANKCRHLLFVCFVFVLLLLFPSCLRVPTPATFSTPSLPPLPLCLNWLGGSSHDQACHPGNYLALSNKAAADSNEQWNIKERRCLCRRGSPASETERRSERSGELRGGSDKRSALHSYINITNVGNRAKHVRVHPSVFICITQPACPLLAAALLDGGCSATSTRATALHCRAPCCASLQRSEVGEAWIQTCSWSSHEWSGHPELPCSSLIWI